MPIDQETLDVLGAGVFLSRLYTQAEQKLPIGLFIGYFPTQRTGVTIHSPKNCLPGAGWSFETSQYVDLIDANGKAHRVGEYIISDGADRQFVIYWYQAHGRSVANEYLAKMYLVTDAMRLNRTDGALVRVITPISANEGTAQAKVAPKRLPSQRTYAPSIHPGLSGSLGAGTYNGTCKRFQAAIVEMAATKGDRQ